MDVLHRAAAAVEERHRLGQRRGELLHLGRSVRHVRPRREHADQHRQRVRRAARAEGRQVRRLARAVSDRLLHEMDGRPHRRSRRRVEGQGTVVDGQHARAVPHGNGQGHDEQGRSSSRCGPIRSRSERRTSIVRRPNASTSIAICTGRGSCCACSGAAPAGADAASRTSSSSRPTISATAISSVYGQAKFQTPNIDRLARSGIRFTSYYAGSTVCAPSRGALMTGLHTGHTWIRGNVAGNSLRDEDRTIATVLRDAGYRTALIGKWGLGESGSPGRPDRKGFDYSFGYLSQTHAHRQFTDHLYRNGQRVEVEPERILERSLHARDDVVHREERQPAVLHLSQLHRPARGASRAGRFDRAVQGTSSRRSRSSTRRPTQS